MDHGTAIVCGARVLAIPMPGFVLRPGSVACVHPSHFAAKAGTRNEPLGSKAAVRALAQLMSATLVSLDAHRTRHHTEAPGD